MKKILFLNIVIIACLFAAFTQSSYAATNKCRNALGEIIVCPPCPFNPTVTLCDIDNQPRVEKFKVLGCKFNTIPDAGADEYYETGCEPYALGVVPVLQLSILSQTATTITIGWTPPGEADGYRFSAAGSNKRSHTWDGTRDRVTFAKGATSYKVEVIMIGRTGTISP